MLGHVTFSETWLLPRIRTHGHGSLSEALEKRGESRFSLPPCAFVSTAHLDTFGSLCADTDASVIAFVLVCNIM